MEKEELKKENSRIRLVITAKELAKIEMATLEEAEERRRRGLTQEPAAVRQKIKTSEDPIPQSGVIPLPTIESLEPMSTRRSSRSEVAGDFLRNVANWLVENRDYELKHLKPDLEVRVEGETEELPIIFLDYLVDEATKSDMDKGVRDLLWSVLRNLKMINIHISSTKISAILKDNDGKFVKLYFNNKPPFDLDGIV